MGITLFVPVPLNTVNVVAPEMAPDVAMIVVLPGEAAMAFPLEPVVLLIVATDVSDELQVTDVVRSRVELSVYVPVAVNC